MTANTILLLDPFGTVEQVEAALGTDAGHFRVVRADRPDGDGVFALMVGPETPVSAEEIAALPDLRIVAVTSTGFDHIPIEAVTAGGGWVTTAAGYCTDEVAEHALALLLAGLRGIPALDTSVRAGVWDVTAIRPRRIAGSSVGLVGFGRIAQALARRLVALDVSVRAYDPITPPEAYVKLGVERAGSAAEAMAGADAVSLHVPLTDGTRGMLDAEAFAGLAPGTFLVNVARGELVDPVALAEAIRSGRLSGAGLDVFATEPLPMDDPLRQLPGVLLGPHGAWYSSGAEARLFTMATASILDVFHGRRPAGAVAAPH